jgi:hypothetical protein
MPVVVAPVVAGAAAAGGTAGGAAGGAGAAGATASGTAAAGAGAKAGAGTQAGTAAKAGASKARAAGRAKGAFRKARFALDLWTARHELLKLLLGILSALVLVIGFPAIAVVALVEGIVGSDPSLPGSIHAGAGVGKAIPVVYAPMYQSAAKAFKVNPYALAALHSTESTYSTDAKAFVPNSVGATGPMQFLPTTWAGNGTSTAYSEAFRLIADERPKRYPHACKPHPCMNDDFDAIAAAAAYLKALGAGPKLDDATFQAFARYKGTIPASYPTAKIAFDLAQGLEASRAALDTPLTGSVLERVYTLANAIEAQRYHYCYGGGHVQPARPSHGSYCRDVKLKKVSGTAYEGLDCSGSVSMLLQHAGVKVPTMTAVEFSRWGERGPGRHVTIWANKGHVFLEIDGRFWGTTSKNYASGPGWNPQGIVGYVARHPAGL